MATLQSTQFGYNPINWATGYVQPRLLTDNEVNDHLKRTINTIDSYQGKEQATFSGVGVRAFRQNFVDRAVIWITEHSSDVMEFCAHLAVAMLNTNNRGNNVHVNGSTFGSTNVTVVQGNNNENNGNSTAGVLLAGGAAGGGMLLLGSFYRRYCDWSNKLQDAREFAINLTHNANRFVNDDQFQTIQTINALFICVAEKIISDHRYKVAIVAGIATGGTIALFGYIFASNVAISLGAATGVGTGLFGLFRLGFGSSNEDYIETKIIAIRNYNITTTYYPQVTYAQNQQQTYYQQGGYPAQGQPYHQQ